jgi:hypothetical protein
MTRRDWTAELVRHGVLGTEAAAAGDEPALAPDRPWYVSAMLGAAGWLASVFAFVFVALLFEPDSAAGFAVLGAVMLAVGFGLYAATRGNAFSEQLALAFSLAGQIAIVWATADATDSAAATAGAATVMQVAIVLVFPNRFAKLLAAFLACVAWALTVRFAWWGESRFADPRTAVALVPALLGWFAIWTPLAIGVQLLIAHEARWMASAARQLARPALTGALAALALATWFSEPFAALSFWTPPAAMQTNWLAIWPLLAVALALFAAISAYRLRDPVLIGIAIAGALLHLVQFYYLLGVTLVVKSWIMFVAGVVLSLAARSLARLPAAAAGGQP